jgi:hypothetical protein
MSRIFFRNEENMIKSHTTNTRYSIKTEGTIRKLGKVKDRVVHAEAASATC